MKNQFLKLKNRLENGIALDLSKFPAHSHTVKRAVQLVSQASQSVYGEKSRHELILSKLLSRSLRPQFQYFKCDLCVKIIYN